MKPKIIVSFPSGENVNGQFALALANMAMQDRESGISNFANSNSCRVAFNRNLLVEGAQKANATHILYIDADTIFPHDALKRLLSYDLDIIGATTSKRDEDGSAVGWPLNGERMKVPSPPIKMAVLGLPFILIKMHVFDKLRKPWFAEPPRFLMPNENYADESLIPEDEYFCFRAREAGFDIWCDVELSMFMGHRGSKTFSIMKPQAE